ncbi:hypothetical protein C8R47DRAFT_1110227 [Mycena vitilis]|nr:hypothetical protein C8R47DRAFT_1110227 [Mycena vitilis]
MNRQTAAASSLAASARQSSISQVIRASAADASDSSALPASDSLSASASASAAPSSSAPPHSDVSASASASASQSASQSPSQSQTPSDTPSPTSSAPPSSASASASQPPSSAAPSSSAPVSSNPPPTTVIQASDSSTTDFVSASPSPSFTTLVTNVDGQLTTVTSALPPPTSLSDPASSPSTAQRTAIIAGATAAGVALVLLLLGGVFVYKRHKTRKREFSEAIGRVRREAHGAGGVGLLDEEGFDDEDVPMRRYQDNAVTHSRSASSLGPPQSPAPSLFRQRAETGSLFREEGVWPPPQGTHVDPLVGVGTGDGLGKIVDEIMGPSPTARKDDARPHIPSMSSASSSSLYADPFRDISHVPAPSDPSLYFDRRNASSSSAASGHSQQTSGSRPTTPQSLLGLPAGAATPKKPSPLAASAVPPTTTPLPAAAPPTSATWLTRSPRKHTRGLSGSQSSHEA